VQPFIRGYGPADLDTVYDICARTADLGGDSRGQYSSDRLIGDIFAAPYVVLEPEHAHVVDDGTGRVVGYILGTADTPTFVRRFREEWLPRVQGRYGDDDPRDAGMLALMRRPERMLVPELAAYPAHLHIDLLPPLQGKGFGRRLMRAFLDGLRAAGVARVHLGMAPANTAARAFYDRLGFTEIPVPGEQSVIYLGRSTR
jgi:ribosomal protein S18 acetylase RimI-like enzyme